MLKKFLILALVVSCSSAIFAQDYRTEWNAVYKLYRAKKYAEAIPAFVALAEKDYAPSSTKYNCYIHAGYSARNLKKYDEAIAFAKKASEVKNHYVYEGKTRELDFMYGGKKYKEITESITADEIMEWPKYYRSNALYYLGLAQYNLKDGESAAKTFKLMHENAVTDYFKTLSLLRSGHTYRNKIKDLDKAAAAFKGAGDIKGAVSHRAEAYEHQAFVLTTQKKNDEGIVAFDKAIALKKLSPYWTSRLLYRKAELLKKMKKNDEAIKLYKAASAVKGAPGWVKSGSKKSLKALGAE